MDRLLILFVLGLILPWHICICQQLLQSEVRITKAYKCNQSKLKWDLQNITISYLYPRSYVNIILNVTEETKRVKKLIVHFDRCNDQGFDCEDFQTWNIDHFCSMLNMKNELLNRFVDSMHPPFRCPVKKTIYQGRNASYDLEAITKWYSEFSKYHWIVTAKVLNERNEIVICVVVESHVYQYRKRNRLHGYG